MLNIINHQKTTNQKNNEILSTVRATIIGEEKKHAKNRKFFYTALECKSV